MNAERYGSDAIVDLLDDLGIDLIPFAPGATFRGIHDSLIHRRPHAPEIIECLHEEISVAVAHGYAKATGKAAAVAIHDIVGLQHASMAIYNAWCDRVPLLLLGGSGPADAAKRRPWIDWIHTANIQATQVRDYTKWDDQPGSLSAAEESITRGVRLAQSAPQGPVYITIDTEIQEDGVDTSRPAFDPSLYSQAAAVAAPADAITEMVDRMLAAERPVIAVESVGRNQQAVDDLVAIAEHLRIPVIEVQRDYNRTELCFPTQHELNLTGVPLPEQPDLVVALEVRDVAVIPGANRASVVQVTTAAFGVKAWAADLQRIQPTEVLVHAEVSSALAQLRREIITRQPSQREPSSWSRALTDLVQSHRAEWRATAQRASAVITPAFLADRLDHATRDHDRVLANGSLHNWVHRLWHIDRSDRYLGSSGGAGLGYGLGASVGVGLAHRGTGRLVIDIQSDGDALMSPQALWTAAKHRVPLLVVMENNRQWGNSYVHAQKIAEARSRSVENIGIGTVIDDPPVDFAALARSFGIATTFTVSNPDDLDAVLTDAVAATLRGETVLVDVLTGEAGE
ncbi:thiamine pyrophosphate-binding protein [Microbacterium sp. YY-01]|uniref:thiamine pyrophosphate-binding protein n=1 Tax=Microbacterium sp. YY-01 TaxID=3421634 RepID=UPI003D168BFC